MITSLSVGFETLRANPLRTVLSTLGIVIGVASLVAVLSVGDGMERVARQQIAGTTDLQSVSVTARQYRMVDGAPFPVADPITLSALEADSLSVALAGSASVNMMAAGSALVTVRGDTTQHATVVQGFLVPYERMADSMLLAGRYFTVAEAKEGTPVATINYRLAADVAGARSPQEVVGDTLLFQGQPRVVIGVLEAVETDRSRRAIMPQRAMAGAMIVGPQDRPQLIVTARTLEGAAPARARIERWAAARYGATWSQRLSIVSNEARLAQMQRGLLLFKVFMGALMSISLVVGGIGIMNVLLSSVMERTREIGIRKATGAARGDILRQFLSESVVITGVGSTIGVALGVSASFAITAIMRKLANVQIEAWLSTSTVLVAIGASVAVGLTAGLYPAIRAAKLSPIDAIHHE